MLPENESWREEVHIVNILWIVSDVSYVNNIESMGQFLLFFLK